jgi:DNA sulfur modification protein DndD
MRLLSVEISNYRQYSGTQTVNLRTEKSTNINIIEGQNNAGKSNILNALTLCFYGRELHQESRSDDMETLPLVTEDALENLSAGESKSGQVKVELGESEPRYIFERQFTTYKIANGSYNDDIDELQLRRRVGSQYKIIENPNNTLNQILPPRVKDYFLFDGEALTEFFEAGYKQRVENAIVDVSHIGLLNSSHDHLETVKKEIRRKANKFEGRPSEIQNTIEEIETTISNKRTQKSQKEKDIEEITRKISDIKDDLRGAANDRARTLVEERERLEQKIDRLKRKKSEARSESCKRLNMAGPAVFTLDALNYTHETLIEMEQKGQLPPKIQDWFVRELIDEGECICGREIMDDSDARKHLEQTLENASEVSTDNLEGKAEIPRIIRDGNNRAEELEKRRRRMTDLSKKIEQTDSDLMETKAKLEGFDVPDDINVSALSKQQDDLEKQKSELETEVGRIEAKIDSNLKRKQKKEKEFRKEARKQNRHKEIINQVEFADTALEEIDSIRNTILGQIREDTQKNLNQYFNELIWKAEEYTIHLTEDYGIEVSGPDSSDNRIGSLSAGESQVLALSFMAALSDISGFQAPIIIDTPLGRIASENRKRIAQNLPTYLEDSQITFLMTDTEYDDNVRNLMKHRVGNEYRLNFEDGQTEVREYGR